MNCLYFCFSSYCADIPLRVHNHGYGYTCAAAGTPLKWLWPKDKSMPEKHRHEASVAVDESVVQEVHSEASVAVHDVMLEHLKVCGQGWAPDRAGTPPEETADTGSTIFEQINSWQVYDSKATLEQVYLWIVAHWLSHAGIAAPQSCCDCR